MSAAPAPGRLCLCDQYQPLGRTGIGMGAQGGIRTGQPIHNLDLQRMQGCRRKQGRNSGGIQHISVRGKGVAAVRHSLNGDPVTAQGSHSLPHRCAADAQLCGQLLPGDIPSACRVQRRQHLLLDHIHAPL